MFLSKVLYENRWWARFGTQAVVWEPSLPATSLPDRLLSSASLPELSSPEQITSSLSGRSQLQQVFKWARARRWPGVLLV